MRYFFSVFCLLLTSLSVAAPVHSTIDNQTVTFSQLLREMEKARGWTVFKNVKVRYNHEEDKLGMDAWFDNPSFKMRLQAEHIGLYNCEFDEEYWLVLNNITFDGVFSMVNCKQFKGIFKNCTFRNAVRLNTNDFEFADFNNCRLEHGFKFMRGNVRDHLSFNHCYFSINERFIGQGGGMDMQDHIFQISNKLEGIDLTIEKSTFHIPEKLQNDPQYFVGLSGSKFTSLRLLEDTLDASVEFSQSTVENQFIIYGCDFKRSILMEALAINQLNARIQWSSVANNKISVWDKINKRIVNGKEESGYQDEFLFTGLISCYATFYEAFRSQGNRLSANDAYIEWKDIETEYQQYLYQKNQDKDTYFGYLMNVFLKIFCDYGTNPLKSLLMSSYVLILFAFIYFVSPIRLTAGPQRNIFTQMRLYARYFTEPATLAQLYHEHLAEFEEKRDNALYVSFLQKHGHSVPRYFKLLASPIFVSKNWFHRLELWLYKRMNPVPQGWEAATPAQRRKASFWFAVAAFLSIIYFVSLRFLDSLTLSLNVFSTLGYGDILAKGLPRYLVIAEGFIGWFLLSIFSVSLVSQVIQ